MTRSMPQIKRISILIIIILGFFIAFFCSPNKANAWTNVYLGDAVVTDYLPSFHFGMGNWLLHGPAGSNYDYWIIKFMEPAGGIYDRTYIRAFLPPGLSAYYNKMVPIKTSDYIAGRITGDAFGDYLANPGGDGAYLGRTFTEFVDDDENAYINANYYYHGETSIGHAGGECDNCAACDNGGDVLRCAANVKTYCGVPDAGNVSGIPGSTCKILGVCFPNYIEWYTCRGFVDYTQVYNYNDEVALENHETIPYFHQAQPNMFESYLADSRGGRVVSIKAFKLYKAPLSPCGCPAENSCPYGTLSSYTWTNYGSGIPCTPTPNCRTNVCDSRPANFNVSVSNPCNGTNCTRAATFTWDQSANAASYTVEVWKNGVYQGTATRNNSNRSYTTPTDDGKNYWDIFVRAFNTAGYPVGANQWPATAGRCDPVVTFTKDGCLADQSARTLSWGQCFADTTNLASKQDCDKEARYKVTYNITYNQFDPSAEALQNQIGRSDTTVTKNGPKNFTIVAQPTKSDPDEKEIEASIRFFGHYTGTKSVTGTPLSNASCKAVNCSTPSSTLYTNSSSPLPIKPATFTYNDSDIIPGKYYKYTATVRRNSDGKTASADSQLLQCSALKGLNLYYDPNITKNPPPGFADLFAPIFKELVP